MHVAIMLSNNLSDKDVLLPNACLCRVDLCYGYGCLVAVVSSGCFAAEVVVILLRARLVQDPVDYLCVVVFWS
jgi:hypothetical protein